MVALINFFILLFSSRYLGVNTRGEISLFLLNIFLIQILNEIYTGYSIIHYVPKYNFSKIIVTGVVFTFSVVTLSNATIILMGKQLPGFEKWGWLISLIVILNTFNCVIILAKQKVKIYNWLSFIQPFILLMGMLISVLFFKIYTVNAYIFPLLFSFSCAFILSSFHIIRLYFEAGFLSGFSLTTILKGGFTYQAGILMFIFSNRFSYYLLDGNANVGLYSAATTITESILIIAASFSPVLISKTANISNNQQSIDLTVVFTKLSFIFSIIIVLLMMLLKESLYITILGSGFKGIKEIVVCYVPGVILVSIFMVLSNYFLAIGKQQVVLKTYALGFISTLVLAPCLVKKHGVLGAACSADISYFLMAVGICYQFKNHTNITLRRMFLIKTDLKNLRNLIHL